MTRTVIPRSEATRDLAAKTEQRTADGVPRCAWLVLTLAAAGPVLTLLVLRAADVPLGMPGKLVYLYSPLVALRMTAIPTAVFIAALLAAGVWTAASEAASRRGVGLALVAVGLVALMIWTYWAPPYHAAQHFFNFRSPSHDGAFVVEARSLLHDPHYLAHFPQRARTPPEQMRGTRVISNPPGATLLAAGVIRVTEGWPPAERCIDWLVAGEERVDDPQVRRLLAESLGFAAALLLMWLAAAPFLYLAARVFVSPVEAAAFAIVCFASPMTLLFAPGKDAAQLLTVALPLWLWLLAGRRGWWWCAALAGGALVLACMLSLVHVWLAAIVLVAGTAAAVKTPGGLRRLLVDCVVPASVAAVAVAAGLYWLLDWNVAATALAVARSQAEVTRGADAMPFWWQALGIPLFLLFGGAAVGTLVPLAIASVRGQTPRRQPANAVEQRRFGMWLIAVTAVVMLATVGFTNIETPRLWIPFCPLLLLGALLAVPWRAAGNRRWALLLAVLVFVQVFAAAVQWHVMDAREAETRLMPDASGRSRLYQ